MKNVLQVERLSHLSLLRSLAKAGVIALCSSQRRQDLFVTIREDSTIDVEHLD